jgi:hypothetical protein
VTAPKDGSLSVSVHGPAVRIEDAIEAGEATKRLLNAVGREMGHPDVAWRVASVQFQCDRCGLLRPDRPGPDEGWTYLDGDDLCPACSEPAS